VIVTPDKHIFTFILSVPEAMPSGSSPLQFSCSRGINLLRLASECQSMLARIVWDLLPQQREDQITQVEEFPQMHVELIHLFWIFGIDRGRLSLN
jgi:hypothetical protein